MFWILFFVSTLISLLIILNMVIAVMSSTFERVESDTEAYIYRAKLSKILQNYHMFDKSLKDELKAFKYILAVEVDPDSDPIGQESMEKRLNEKIEQINEKIAIQQE